MTICWRCRHEIEDGEEYAELEYWEPTHIKCLEGIPVRTLILEVLKQHIYKDLDGIMIRVE